jgi:hypothetical protein
MKAVVAFTSLMAPHIERYLTLKQALGREYDGVRRVLAHVDHFATTQGGDLDVGHLRWMVFDIAAPGVRDSSQPHADRTKFLPLSTPP